MNFGEQIKRIRKEQNMTQGQFAEKLGISRQAVSNWENDRNLPDIEMLEKSKIPFAYFMTWSKEFCIGEQYNSKESMRKMYNSSYAITL